MAEDTGSSTAAGGGDTAGASTSETGTDARAGQELTREALEAELHRARNDAAKYRTRAREFGDDEQYQKAKDAVAALEKAEQDKKSEVEKLTERNEQLLYTSSASEAALLRMRIALGAGIAPSQVEEFASRLQGKDEGELKADAEKLAKFFQTTSTGGRRGDPSQGAGSDSTSPGDPLLEAVRGKLGISH